MQGVAHVVGVQDGGVAATVKHFVANDCETDRMTVNVQVSERALRELYLAPFEHIVTTAHPYAIMAAYNSVNRSEGGSGMDAVEKSAQGWRVMRRRLRRVARKALPTKSARRAPGQPWGPWLKWLKDQSSAALPSVHSSGAKRSA